MVRHSENVRDGGFAREFAIPVDKSPSHQQGACDLPVRDGADPLRVDHAPFVRQSPGLSPAVPACGVGEVVHEESSCICAAGGEGGYGLAVHVEVEAVFFIVIEADMNDAVPIPWHGHLAVVHPVASCVNHPCGVRHQRPKAGRCQSQTPQGMLAYRMEPARPMRRGTGAGPKPSLRKTNFWRILISMNFR